MPDVLELPCIVRLQTGKVATLALCGTGDGAALLEFYRAMSAEDRQFLTDDVTTGEWLDRFLGKLARREAMSVIGRVEGRVCGEATLHRAIHGWTRHVGEIRINVDRTARGQGLGLLLAQQIVRIATDEGIDKLMAQMVDGQGAAKRTFEKLGFHREARLSQHVVDLRGKKRDLLVYANDVSHMWQAMESLLVDFHPSRSGR